MTNRLIRQMALAIMLAGGVGFAFAADSKVFVAQQQVTDQSLDAQPTAPQAMQVGGTVMGEWQVSQTTGGYNAGGGEGGTWIPVSVTYARGLCISGWAVNYGTLGAVFTGNGQEVAERRLDRACPFGSGNIPP